MVKDEIATVEKAAKEGCIAFIKCLRENFVPENKKAVFSDEALADTSKLDNLLSMRLSLIFHPNKQINKPRQS